MHIGWDGEDAKVDSPTHFVEDAVGGYGEGGVRVVGNVVDSIGPHCPGVCSAVGEAKAELGWVLSCLCKWEASEVSTNISVVERGGASAYQNESAHASIKVFQVVYGDWGEGGVI